MKIHVNLATRPFVELRPFFLRLRIVMGVLAAVALALGITSHVYAVKLHRAQAQMDEVHNQIVATQQEKNRAETSMRQPANAAVLERAHFLNTLFLRKSFSWTAVMMDLENVLPSGVQVTSIEPSVTPDGDVLIRLRVAGDRDRAVQLVRNLERSERFLHPRLSGESSQNKENANGTPAAAGAPTGVEFDILAEYNPLPANEPFRYPRVHAEEAVPARTSAVIAPTPLPVRASAAASPYPRDGVVLKPYTAPAATPAAVAPSPQPAFGGPRAADGRPMSRPMPRLSNSRPSGGEQ